MDRGVPLHLIEYQQRDVVQAVVLRVRRNPDTDRVEPQPKHHGEQPTVKQQFKAKWRKRGLADWRIDAYWEVLERGKKAHSKG